MQRNALRAVRAGRRGVHVTAPGSPRPYEAVSVTPDGMVQLRYMNGEPAPPVHERDLWALARAYEPVEPDPDDAPPRGARARADYATRAKRRAHVAALTEDAAREAPPGCAPEDWRERPDVLGPADA